MLLSRIEREDLCFTLADAGEAPLPFVAGARTVLLLPEQTRKRGPTVAILGYGLGAIGGMMAALAPPARIVGVESSARLAAAARRRLPETVELRRDDALTFLRRTRLRFDLVFDDCFELRGDEAVRPPRLLAHAPLVRRRMQRGGIYVRNLLPQEGLLPGDQQADIDRAFRWVRQRRFRDYDNVFAIASDHPLPSDRLRRLSRR